MSPHDAPQGWTTSDALLLLSVGRRRGVSIDSLLSTTDARDASVPSETESAVGLGTLMASGLVEIVEGGIVDATAQDDELVLTFEHGETLQVWRPGSLTVSERELVIKDADRVRWEWGDPHGSAGDRPRLSIEHVRHGAQVEVTQEFLGRYDSRRSQPTRRPAVKIVGF